MKSYIIQYDKFSQTFVILLLSISSRYRIIVLIGDVRFVKRSRDIATRITGEEISVSNKHLDQNERLDDFGSRTRPQFFFSDRNLNIYEMTRTRTMVSRLGPALFPCLTYLI